MFFDDIQMRALRNVFLLGYNLHYNTSQLFFIFLFFHAEIIGSEMNSVT